MADATKIAALVHPLLTSESSGWQRHAHDHIKQLIVYFLVFLLSLKIQFSFIGQRGARVTNAVASPVLPSPVPPSPPLPSTTCQ